MKIRVLGVGARLNATIHCPSSTGVVSELCRKPTDDSQFSIANQSVCPFVSDFEMLMPQTPEPFLHILYFTALAPMHHLYIVLCTTSRD